MTTRRMTLVLSAEATPSRRRSPTSAFNFSPHERVLIRKWNGSPEVREYLDANAHAVNSSRVEQDRLINDLTHAIVGAGLDDEELFELSDRLGVHPRKR